jgi:hypothetical protein
MPTKDYMVQTQGRRQLLLNKQDDGTYQVKIFLAGPDKLLATMVLERGEFKRLRDTATGLMKK